MMQLLVLGPHFGNHCYKPTYSSYENLVEKDTMSMGHEEKEDPTGLKKKKNTLILNQNTTVTS